MTPWHQEIVEFHNYFEALFLGTTETLDRAERALHPDFTMAGPHGTVADRAAVLHQLEAGRGHAKQLKIAIRDAELIHASADVVVAGYVEVHDLANGLRNERRSTVVFSIDSTGPNGLRWLRVHETFVE